MLPESDFHYDWCLQISHEEKTIHEQEHDYQVALQEVRNFKIL